jgi:hypothetical protein
MQTETKTYYTELFETLFELVIGVPLTDIPQSQQKAASDDVLKYIFECIIASTYENHGKLSSVRMQIALTKDQSIVNKFPALKDQLRVSFDNLIKSL